MLERPSLCLGPWSQSADRPARCAIVDPATQLPLGLAQRRPMPASFWRRWFVRPTLEVLETEDEALLCMVRRLAGFRPAWEVCDADGRYVGGIRGPKIVDPFGRAVCLAAAGTGSKPLSYLTPDGLELATLSPQDDRQLLTFGPALDGNPFARMLLLAAALAGGVTT